MLTRSKAQGQEKVKGGEEKKRGRDKVDGKKLATEVNENEPNRGTSTGVDRESKKLKPTESKQQPPKKGLTLRVVPNDMNGTENGKKRKGGKRNSAPTVNGNGDQMLSDTLFSKAELEEALLAFERQEGFDDGNDFNTTDIGEFGFNAFIHRDLLKQRESVYAPKFNYLSWHPSLTPKTRVVLVSWLIEVAEEFRFQRETLHMAINFVDRFLSCVPRLCRSKFQLIGVASLFIACKIEEQQWPALSTLTQLTDGACNNDDVLQMEQIILQKLSWHLLPLTPNTFLRLYLYILTKYDVEPEPAKVLTSKKKKDIASPELGEENVPEITRLNVSFERFHIGIPNILQSLFDCYKILPHLIILQSIEKIEYVTGYNEAVLTPCVEWVRRFVNVAPPKAYTSPVELLPSDFYNYQISNPVSKQFVESYL